MTALLNKYAELSDAEYTSFRKKLLQTKDLGQQLEDQKEFLGHILDSKGFCNWFREQVPSKPGEQFPLIKDRLSDHIFKDPPADTEQDLYDNWEDLTVAVACKPTFWGEVTLSHIENGLIDASYLASNGGNTGKGLSRIEKALVDPDTTKVNNCVLASLRRLSGLPEKRGNRSVYVDCPFARAWWRVKICKDVHEGIVDSDADISENEIIDIFRVNQGYWEKLVEFLVSRNSVLGDRKARDSLVWALIEIEDENLKEKLFNQKNLSKLCRVLGIRAAWQEFGVLETTEVKDLILEEIHARKW